MGNENVVHIHNKTLVIDKKLNHKTFRLTIETKDIIPNEVTHVQKGKCCAFSSVCRSKL